MQARPDSTSSLTSYAPPPSGRPVQNNRRGRGLILVSAALISLALAPFAVGILGAVVLYEVSAPLFARLKRRLRPRLSASVIIVLIVALIVTPAVWLAHEIVGRVPAARAALTKPGAENSATAFFAQVGVTPEKVQSSIASWLPGAMSAISRGAAWGFVNWTIALLGVFYLLTAPSGAGRRLGRMLPLSERGVDELARRLSETTRAMVAGTLLSAAIQGAAIGFGFWLAGISEPLLWAAVAAFATLIPVLGNALVWGPALALTVLQQRYTGALAIGVFGGLGPPIIDRVVRAAVSQRHGGTHPMITLVGALAGVRLAGVAGLVLGPVVLAMFFALVDVCNEENAQPTS